MGRKKAIWSVVVDKPYHDTHWMDHARCLEVDPDIFFPQMHEISYSLVIERIAAANAVCMLCPVRKACEAYSEKMSLGCGIWGTHVYEKEVSDEFEILES